MMPIMRRRLGEGWSIPKPWAIRARMKSAPTIHSQSCEPVGQLDQAEQDQEEGRVLDEIGLGPHPPDQGLDAAVADRDLVEHAHPADAAPQPDVDQGGRPGDGESDRKYHVGPPLPAAVSSHAAATLATAAEFAIGGRRSASMSGRHGPRPYGR
jgi:hypothetical protein